ncbi:hypothetical protein A9Q73_08735 [Bermanella sp. 47_1433_sub80_T6]|nr:hypothetical protein A9Q73_08735 [Bermanella sp. 47_1433_sub80_T6]
MKCRLDCAACCIAPSISSFIPGMPRGKKAGERCVQLDENDLCLLFGKTDRPKVCGAFQAEFDICGDTREQAMDNIIYLESVT